MSRAFIDKSPLVIAKIENNASVMLRLMIRDIHKQAEPNTPYRNGSLRAEVLEQVNGLRGSIGWGVNYAKKQEEGSSHGTWHYTTPGTGPHFARDAVSLINDNLSEYARKARL